MSEKSLTNTRTKNIQHKRAVSQAFGSIAQGYDFWYKSARGNYVWLVETQAIQSLFPATVPKVVLEIGVGTGKAISLLENDHSQLIGIDFAWQMLAVARQKFTNSDNVHLVLADGASLPFRTECSDLAFSMTVLEFVPDRDEFFKEIYRCLHPSGNFLLGVLTSVNLWALERRIRNLTRYDVFGLASFPSPWQVIRRLCRNGFTQIQYRGSVYAPPFAPEVCLPVVSKLEVTLSNRWLIRALGAFTVFSAKRCGAKEGGL